MWTKTEQGISSKDLSLLKLHPFFKQKKLVIADGHHRYESALAYGKEMGFTGGAFVRPGDAVSVYSWLFGQTITGKVEEVKLLQQG